MIKNVETMLDYLSEIRKVYAAKLKIEYEGQFFSPNEINILIMLSNNKSIETCGQLNLLMRVSKGLISRSISSLTDKGLVKTWESENDKRSRQIALTSAAEPVIEKINAGIKEISEVILADISADEIEQMCKTMEKIIRNFKASEDKAL